MSALADYLALLAPRLAEPRQQAWFARLKQGVSNGQARLDAATPERRQQLRAAFDQRVRTEELKAWYGAPERGSLFQGTSVSSLTLPCELERPLDLSAGMDVLEAALAEHYIRLHDAHETTVRAANLESVDRWMAEGLFFGAVVSSKLLSQALGLTVHRDAVVFPVDGVLIDPHEITSYPAELREAYFIEAQKRIDCYADFPLDRREFEQSLALADISKPRIERYRDQLLLGPIRCNEIAALLARRVAGRVRDLSRGRIAPRSLMVTIYDTDTPYTYHRLSGHAGLAAAPVLPGLTVLGSSGSIDAFRWLYSYRVSLLAQKIQKSSLWSQVERRFIPFVYFGVLVERDAEILLDLDRLDLLRYPGMLSPPIEYAWLIPGLDDAESESPTPATAPGELATRLP